MSQDTSTPFNDTSTSFAHKSDAELSLARWIFTLLNMPLLAGFFIRAGKWSLKLRLPVMGLIKKTFFAQFCGGESLEQCKPLIEKMSGHKVNTALDYSVEAACTEVGFEETAAEIKRALDVSKKHASCSFCVFKVTGLADTRLLEKIQRRAELAAEEEEAFKRVRRRVDRICRYAHKHGVPVLIDAESSWFQDPVDVLAYTMMQHYNKERPIVFNTFQMYRSDMPKNLRQAYRQAVENNYFLGVKMVRGAYLEEEQRRAQEQGYPNPLFGRKEDTDDAFNNGLAFCMERLDRIALLCGSHNDYSNHYLTLLMERRRVANDDLRVWFLQLYGMRDNISFDLAAKGYNVAKYLPYGPARAVIPYLIRRAEENSSVAGQSRQELTLIREEQKRRKEAASGSLSGK